jgi:chromosome segregation ATPase
VVSLLPQTLAFDLTARLRKVLAEQPATESELRTLAEQADAWARALEGQIHASERRLRDLDADAASPLAEIASELRRLESLRPELAELRGLVAELEARARELRAAWLSRQAASTQASRHS